MTLINIRNLGVTLSAPLFSRLDLSVNAGDRIGLVAANGRGKTTFLRCIAGMVEPSDGKITRSRGLTIGYVEQDVPSAFADTPFHAAVLDMLPRGTLGRQQINKLKVYAGDKHPHAAQNPKVLEIK